MTDRRAALVKKALEAVTLSAYEKGNNLQLSAEDLAAAIDIIRAEVLEEAARVAEKMSDDWVTEWRRTLKADSHMEGMSDGADDVAAAIRALASK